MSNTNPLDVIEAADVTSLTAEEKAAAFIKGTKSLHKLMEGAVCSVIMGQVGKSAIEEAIAATFYRITLLLRGVSILEDPAHFQIANSVARTIFELTIDIKALCDDPSLVAKFLAFTQVVKFRKAEQLSGFLNSNQGVDRSPHQHALSFASDPQRKQAVEQLCIQHWGANKNRQPNWPDHWSGRSIADRAHDAGLEFEESYRSQFFLQSQYVHAGPAGIQDLPWEALIYSFGVAHRLMQQLSAKATELVGGVFHLFDATPELRDALHRASSATGFYAVEAVLQKQNRGTVI